MVLSPPAELLQDCPVSPYALVLTGDLVRAVRSLNNDMRLCNSDKAALRAWYTRMAAPPVVSVPRRPRR